MINIMGKINIKVIYFKKSFDIVQIILLYEG